MARLIKQQVNRVFAAKVKQLTSDLSDRSSVVAVRKDTVACPNCVYDPVLKASSGKYQVGGPTPFTGKQCPVCKSKGQVTTETRREIKCNVRWGLLEPQDNIVLSAGEEVTELARLKCDLERYGKIVDAAAYFVVDGKRCTLKGHPVPRGLLNYVIKVFYVKLDK